jgi:hypothetical protein
MERKKTVYEARGGVTGIKRTRGGAVTANAVQPDVEGRLGA